MLLREMQIQNPTAVMIARTAVAQDDVTGCARAVGVMCLQGQGRSALWHVRRWPKVS